MFSASYVGTAASLAAVNGVEVDRSAAWSPDFQLSKTIVAISFGVAAVLPAVVVVDGVGAP